MFKTWQLIKSLTSFYNSCFRYWRVYDRGARLSQHLSEHYTWPSVLLCVSDIDECMTGEHGCPSTATCQNTIGAYQCQCGYGFYGDRKTCKGRPHTYHDLAFGHILICAFLFSFWAHFDLCRFFLQIYQVSTNVWKVWESEKGLQPLRATFCPILYLQGGTVLLCPKYNVVYFNILSLNKFSTIYFVSFICALDCATIDNCRNGVGVLLFPKCSLHKLQTPKTICHVSYRIMIAL